MTDFTAGSNAARRRAIKSRQTRAPALNSLMTFAALTLDITGASVSRGTRVIVTDFSLTVRNGEIVWLRGTNGVGKTSLLRMAAGLARPDVGTLTRTLGGTSVNAAQFTGFQGHKDPLKPSLTVLENIRFWAKLAGNKRAIAEALQRVGLTGRDSQAAGTLSAGQSRRLALAQLWVSRKPLWILDEPAAAIDSVGQRIIDDLIKEHTQNGGAVMLASHAAPSSMTDKMRFVTLSADTGK